MRVFEFILREYSREVTAQKMGAALLQKFRKEPQQWQERVVGNRNTDDQSVLQNLLGFMEMADPTKNKQYVPWIIRAYTNTPSLKFEDAVSHVHAPLQKFFKLVSKKQIPAPNNDIGRVKDLATLVRLVDQYPDVSDEPKLVDRGQAKPYYDDADIRVIIPEDEKAACYYGQGTKWCTAGRENNMFNRYNQEGEMYIIMPKKPAHPGEKYQFHFQTKQFMDEKDHRIHVSALRQRWPQLATIFARQAKENHVLALDPEITDIAGMMNKAMPKFQDFLLATILQHSRAKAKEIYVELGRAVRSFRGVEELWELAEDMLDRGSIIEMVQVATYIVRDNPDVANDDDALYDLLGDPITQFVRNSELWMYVTDLIEDDFEDAEFDAAMTIEGELNSMLQKLIPEAFSKAIEEVKREQQ